jgi:hypothetical protein
LDLAGTWLFAVDRIDAEGDVRGKLTVFTAEEVPDVGPEAIVAARKELERIDWLEFDRDRVDFADPREALRVLDELDDLGPESSP